MSSGENARREARNLAATAPGWVRTLKPFFVAQHRLRRLVGGIYRQEPFNYAIYQQTSPERRVSHQVDQPTFRWRTNSA